MARSNGALVVATQDWHPPSTPHFAKDGGIWPVHCVADTWGAALHPDLALPDDAPRVRKGSNGEDGYSASRCATRSAARRSPTELEALLRAAGVERVVVVGLATDYCVKATALDAVAARLRHGAPDRRGRRGRPRAGRRRARASTRCEAAGVGDVADGDAMIRGAVRLAHRRAPASRYVARSGPRATRPTGAPPAPIQSMVVIDAPIERVWAVARATSRASRAGCTT